MSFVSVCGAVARSGAAPGNGSTACCVRPRREVWSSGPSADAVAARKAWKALELRECLSWTQSGADMEVKLLLPAGACDADVSSHAEQLGRARRGLTRAPRAARNTQARASRTWSCP